MPPNVFERDAGGLGVWGQTQKLTASDAKGGDFFGDAAATEDDLLLIGASSWSGPSASDAGAVYVFERTGASWVETALLTASDAGPSSNFGSAIALDGDAMVVAAPNDDGAGTNRGAVYVFRRDALTGSWIEEQKLLPRPPRTSRGSATRAVSPATRSSWAWLVLRVPHSSSSATR